MTRADGQANTSTCQQFNRKDAAGENKTPNPSHMTPNRHHKKTVFPLYAFKTNPLTPTTETSWSMDHKQQTPFPLTNSTSQPKQNKEVSRNQNKIEETTPTRRQHLLADTNLQTS
jgi:hypothetical protein